MLRKVLSVLLLTFSVVSSPCYATRIWQSGFESGNVQSGVTEWGGTQDLTNFTLDTSVVRSGTYSGKFTGPGYLQSVVGNVMGKTFCRFYVYLSGPVSQRNYIFQARGAGDTPLFGLYLLPDSSAYPRCIEVNNDALDFVVGISPLSIPIGVWTLIECEMQIPGGYIELRINGVTQVQSYSNSWQPISVDHLQIGPKDITHPLGCDIWYDDLAWNDNWGAHSTDPQNNWCGEGHIVNLSPTSDSPPNQWTPVGTVSHFSSVADLPGTPDTTTYLHVASTTVGLSDRWGLQSYPISPQINEVLFGVRGWGTNKSGTANLSLVDSSNNVVNGINPSWNHTSPATIYPILSVDTTWDGFALPLTKPYLDLSFPEAILTNNNGKAINWTTVWTTVDYQ